MPYFRGGGVGFLPLKGESEGVGYPPQTAEKWPSG
jgi:hypothetical protein